MAYLGNTPTQQGFTPAIDYFSGNASTTAFTLSRPVASVAQVQAVIENVPQNPGDAFTVSGNTITFTSAPPSGTNNIYVYYTSPITTVVQPGQGTVGTAQLVSGLTLTDPVYTGTLTGGTGVVNIGSGQLYKDSSGNVGIGTSSPSSYQGGGKLAINQAVSGTSVVWSDLSNDTGFLDITSGAARIRANNQLVFNTNGAERMRIDSSGRVTMPYQPAFFAYYTGGASNSGTAVDDKITFNNTYTNTGSHYSTSTGRFTAPIAGNYYISACVTWYASGVSARYIRAQVFKNGGTPYVLSGHTLMSNETGDSDYNMVSINGVVTLAANDYLEVYWATSASTGVIYLAGFNANVIFSGYLLG